MNRYYRPSAPKYTSQFVEEQYPTDMMLGVMNMKAQQQSEFAKSVGTLQALASSIPNGLRTETMAPMVRDDWSNKIRDWSTKNMNNYDSPQAIAELASLHTSFQSDPNIQLLKKDAADSEMYVKMLMQSGASDIDMNIDERTGTLAQFQPGDYYQPYRPFVKDPDVTKRILEEFSLVPENEYTSSYLSYTQDAQGNVVPIHGTQTSKRTNETQYDVTMQNFIQRGLEGKEDWAVYQTEKFKRMYGRKPTAEDWYNIVAPVASRTKEKDYADRWSPYSSSGSGKEQESPLSGETARGKIVDTPKEYMDVTKSDSRKMARAAKDPGFTIEKYPEWYNIHNMMLNNPKYKNAYSQIDNWNDRFKFIKKNYLDKTATDTYDKKYHLNTEMFTQDIEKDKYARYFGIVNEKGFIEEEPVAETLAGELIYDYNTGEEVQDVDKKNIAAKGNHVKIKGRTSPNFIGKAIAPGLITVEVGKGKKADIYQIQDANYAEEEREAWNYMGFQRSISGVGDGFVLDIYNTDQYKITDKTNASYGARGDALMLNAARPNQLYLVPMIDQADGGKYKVKVFADNPNGVDPENAASLMFNQQSPLLLKEYDFSDYGGDVEALHKAIMIDADPNNQNSLLYKKEAIIGR
jgi:hypothetical protein